MTDDKPMTVEQLQQALLDMQTKNELLESQLAEKTTKLETTESSLAEARRINGQLYSKVSIGKAVPEPDDESEKEPTKEEILESIYKDAIFPNIDHMKKIFGDDKVGNWN